MKKLLSLLLLLAGLSPLVQAQTVTTITPPVNITASTSSTVAGNAVTLTCTFNGGVTSGSAQFEINGTQFVSPAITLNSSGVAVYTTSVPPGTDDVSCTGPGNASFTTVVANTTVTATANPSLSWVTANQIVDASYVPLVKGKICFTPVDGNNNAAPFEFPNTGTVRPIPVCRTVVNGAITGALMLARSNVTTPVGINYSIAITDSTTGATQTQGIGPVTGDIWNLGNFAPSTVQTAPVAAWVVGPAGPQGPAGPAGNSAASGSAGSIQVAGSNGQLTAGTSAQILAALPFTPANKAGDTFTGLLQASNGLTVSGQSFTNSSGAEEIGSLTTAGPSYHDYHSSGSNNDYDVRQIATGGVAGTTGQGTYQLIAASALLPLETTIGGNQICTSAGGVNCPASSGAVSPSGSTSGALIISGGSGSALSYASAIKQRVEDGGIQAGYSAFKGPEVSIKDDDFGVIDAKCTSGSTAANDTVIQAAVAYVISLYSSGSLLASPTLYFPKGCYDFSQTILDQNGSSFNIRGDGKGRSILIDTATTATTGIKLIAAGTPLVYTGVYVRDLTIQAQGHLSPVDLLDVINTANSTFDSLQLFNTGGIALNMQGASERDHFHNLEIDASRRSINMGGNTNEDYFTNLHVIQPGSDNNNYNWNINAVNGAIPANATIYPDERAAVTILNGQNIHVDEGSVKGINNQSAFQFIHTNGWTVNRMYCEAFNLPSVNTCIQNEGASPIGMLTSALSSSATTATMSNALYQPQYYSTAADVTTGNYLWAYQIQPYDYVQGSTTASAICAGVSGCTITQGTIEYVSTSGFYGSDTTGTGTASFGLRGQSGSTAQNWPAGAIVVLQHTNISDGSTHNNHFNGILGLASGETSGCSTSTVNMPTSGTGFIGGTARNCGEVVDGAEPDGYSAFPGGTGSPSGNLAAGIYYSDNDEFYAAYNPGLVTTYGQGIISTPMSGLVKQRGVNCPLYSSATLPSSTNLFTVYSNTNCNAVFAAGANVTYDDINGKTHIDTLNKDYSQGIDIYQQYGGIVGQQFYGDYSVRDLGVNGSYGGIKETVQGYPFAPLWSIGYNGTNWITAGPAGTTVNAPLNLNAPVLNNNASFIIANATVTSAQHIVMAGPQNSAITITYPDCTAAIQGADFDIVSIFNNGYPVVITTATGKGIYGATATGLLPALNPQGDLHFICPANGNYQVISATGSFGTASVTAGAGAGTGATGTASALSNNKYGTVTITTTAAGTASSLFATITTSQGLPRVPTSCTLTPTNAATAALATDFYRGTPTATTCPIEAGATPVPVGTYTFDYAFN